MESGLNLVKNCLTPSRPTHLPGADKIVVRQRFFRHPLEQHGPGTEPEPETGTAGTVFPGTERGTGTVGTVFQEPKPEPSLGVKTALNQKQTLSREELSEPKTGTARTFPCTNRNRTEPNLDHPAERGFAKGGFVAMISWSVHWAVASDARSGQRVSS